MPKHDFDDVYARTKDKVWALACRALQDRHLAEDAMQEVFVLVYRFLKGFSGRSSVETWVYRIAVNLVIRARKQQTKKRTLAINASAKVDGNVESSELIADVNRVIDDLDDSSAKIVSLVLFQGCSQIEAAEILQIPVGTVYSRLFRAKEILREKLKRAGYEQ